MIEHRVEHEVHLIAVTVFKDISGTFLSAVGVGCVFRIVEIVDIVYGIPVNLTERFLMPPVGVHVIKFLVVGIERRKVTVVVGLGVTGVVPVESRSGVVDPTKSGTGVKRCSGFGLPDPVEDESGVESLHNLGAALLAILPTPCGIVEVIPCEVVGFEEGSRVGSTLCRSTERGECQRVLRIELLFE